MYYILKRRSIAFFIFLMSFLYPCALIADENDSALDISSIQNLIDIAIREDFNYYGLASFYGGVNIYVLRGSTLIKINEAQFQLDKDDKLIVSGRYKVLIISKIFETIALVNNKLTFYDDGKIIESSSLNSKGLKRILIKSHLTHADGPLYELKYAHLWHPLKIVSNLTEKFFVLFDNIIAKSWGINIILLAFIFKLFSLPIDILSSRSRQKINIIKKSISHLLLDVQEKKIGAEAKHKEYMKIHKDAGVSPFYELRPLIYTIFPIPFLIAIFNVLGESFLLSGQSFLWINDLAYPDNIYNFSFEIPLIGNSLNLLPLIMLTMSSLLAIFHKSQNTELSILRKQKVNLFLIGVLFFILFYPFPSALILFWVFTSIFGYGFQRLTKND